MYLKRRRNVKRNLGKRVNRMFKRYRPKIYRKPISQQTYRFKRSVTLPSLRSDTVVDYATNYVFKLSDLPNYTEFTSLFDEYKISCIVLKFTPLYPTNLSATDYGQIYTMIDKDDNATLSVVQAQQYQNIKVRGGLKGKTIVIRPKIKGLIYNNSGVTTGQSSLINEWIDVAYPDVTHYCLKNVWTQTPVVTLYQRVEATYYLKFKNVR